MPSSTSPKILNLTVIVAALGYFVDIYDLLLFGIVREASLKGLGIAPGQPMLDVGTMLFNYQMGGMLLGGILWGIMGDRRGRISVLFGSIFLYSIANIANGLIVHLDSSITIPAYALCRLFAGIGLAGELGAAITLVSEIMPKETRGYSTAIVASVGILGAVVANLVGREVDWTTAYIIGGVLGLALLVLRVSIYESGMYSTMSKSEVPKGKFLMLFTSGTRFLKYLRCILIGVPLWFVVGILVIFSPEITAALGVRGKVSGGDAIMYCYIGLAIGDVASGFLSQYFRTRKKVVMWFVLLSLVWMAAYLFRSGAEASYYYWMCGLLGFASGYWAVFVTTAAEQFGTNLRATVATTVPNFVRGSVVPLSLLVAALRPSLGIISAAAVVGSCCIGIALIALAGMEESYHKELDYLEIAEGVS